ncbi:hypothetical protein [Ruegeria sp. HKCCC2117]|uniref:hypothetical protein n=1 Tax=Ruegeria sp. HKCCC2117 TaxID=2682992 RepID=UPI00148886D2|nr:hypothetical protein [Ruegeria sp. HKCCC2117]
MEIVEENEFRTVAEAKCESCSYTFRFTLIEKGEERREQTLCEFCSSAVHRIHQARSAAVYYGARGGGIKRENFGVVVAALIQADAIDDLTRELKTVNLEND